MTLASYQSRAAVGPAASCRVRVAPRKASLRVRCEAGSQTAAKTVETVELGRSGECFCLEREGVEEERAEVTKG